MPRTLKSAPRTHADRRLGASLIEIEAMEKVGLFSGRVPSRYRADDPICQVSQDVSTPATHVQGAGYDGLMDRYARWLPGAAPEAGDPGGA
jgi:hypothetical protein